VVLWFGLRSFGAVLAIVLFLISAIANAQGLNWEKLTELPAVDGQRHPGLGGAFIGVHNDVLIIAGGANFPEGMPWEAAPERPAPKIYHDTIHVLSKSADGVAWIPQTTRLPHALAYGIAVPTPDGLLCFGGEWKDRPVDGVQGLHLSDMAFAIVWDPLRKQVRVTRKPGGKMIGKTLPGLPGGLAHAAAARTESTIYAAGGIGRDGAGRRFWALDLSAEVLAWKALPDFPGPVRVAAVAAGVGDAFYLLSGRDPTVQPPRALTDFWRYRGGAWTALPLLPRPMVSGTALGGKGTMMVVGGSRDRGFSEIMTAMAKARSGDKTADARWRELQRTHAGFEEQVLAWDAETGEWWELGHLPEPGPVTTRVMRWNGGFVVPGGEVRPGVRDPTVWFGRP